MGFLWFGDQITDYSSFTEVVLTLLRLILGDFVFSDLEGANRVLGPLFFLCYVFFCLFFLLNMFLAIINESYSAVKEEMATEKQKMVLGDIFLQVSTVHVLLITVLYVFSVYLYRQLFITLVISRQYLKISNMTEKKIKKD